MEWTGGAPRSTPASGGDQEQGARHASPFQRHRLNKRGAIILRLKLSRTQLEAKLANLPPCLVGMEACVGAQHLSRRLKSLGHDPRLMPAKYAKAFLKGNKNDFRDAEAIAERPTMRFVATKTC
jgi:transposase